MASVQTFDLKITQKSGPEHTIAWEEHEGIETFLKAKKVCAINNMTDGDMIMTIPLNTDHDHSTEHQSRPNQLKTKLTQDQTELKKVVADEAAGLPLLPYSTQRHLAPGDVPDMCVSSHVSVVSRLIYRLPS